MIDDINTPYYDKVSLAVVIAHELTHEYFGNLVTPQFWDFIWLSEGFSTLYEYYALTLIHPEWKTMELFHIQRFQSVLKIDSLTTAQPMNNIIKHPDGIRASLNIFSYDKSEISHEYRKTNKCLTFTFFFFSSWICFKDGSEYVW